MLTTVNIQHLESLNDVVEQITGIAQQETVPDAVVRRADQIELVDMTPEALQRRLAHGNVYPLERVDAALSNYFRVGNLTALRELALLWLADRVDEGLRRYKAEHHIDHVWEARERVVVALTGGPEGETLIRRASRVAQRSGGDLLAVHVLASDGLTGASPARPAHAARPGGEPGRQLPRGRRRRRRARPCWSSRAASTPRSWCIGTSRRSRWARALRRGIGGQVIADSGEIDVHIVTHSAAGSRGWRLPPLTGALTPPPAAGRAALLAVVGVPVLTGLCLAARGVAVHRAPGLPAARPGRRPDRRPVARRWGPRCSVDWRRTGSSCRPRGS